MNQPPSDNRTFFFHPYNVMLHLLLFGLCAMFLALTVSYVYSRIQGNVPPVKLPLIFLFNTLLLLASSRTMILAKRAYQNDDTEGYQNRLLWTILLSLLFMFAQAWGWFWLFSNNLKMNTSTTIGYLYVISILHFMHVVAGLPFLIIFWLTAKKRMVEPVSVLVYFSDPEKRLKLRLLTIYWHFLDGLWVYLVLFFLVNRLIG